MVLGMVLGWCGMVCRCPPVAPRSLTHSGPYPAVVRVNPTFHSLRPLFSVGAVLNTILGWFWGWFGMVSLCVRASSPWSMPWPSFPWSPPCPVVDSLLCTLAAPSLSWACPSCPLVFALSSWYWFPPCPFRPWNPRRLSGPCAPFVWSVLWSPGCSFPGKRVVSKLAVDKNLGPGG